MVFTAMKRAIRIIKEYARPYVFGMIHVPALPGTPMNTLSLPEILEIVKKESEIYASSQVDGIIVENMHDIPYVKPPIGPEITSSMTLACKTVSETLGQRREKMLLGLQILAGANKEAIAVAHCTGFDLIRAECFVFSHVADEGWMDGCAGELLRYRRLIGAESVAIVTDVKKKHSSHTVTSDIPIGGVAEGAEFFLADGVVVTGRCTGDAADTADFDAVRTHCSLPIFIGSGVTASNVHQFRNADALIVGSEFKKEGKWMNELDGDRVKHFMNRVNTLSSQL
ncbi:BtpA domain containing protein isoform 5 [Trichostrongylus colubriformis]|uniref:BtpA domain containing protein isoform 5 n=1 Tax=Trichostrongylus colubriformis TaxID=6319 RepID=A0AAN8IPY4_TRICO